MWWGLLGLDKGTRCLGEAVKLARVAGRCWGEDGGGYFVDGGSFWEV